ncbi:MAG TPA: trigger factor [Vicinamibacterales bacterium]|nr:trigger factor [Vicinamibacterales bacterium]
MKSDLVEVSETKKNLIIEVPPEEVDAEIDRVTREYSRSARIPGFRPGKVPPRVVKQRFRNEILHEVAHELIPRAVDAALQEKGLDPIDTPDVGHVDVHEGEALTFTATIETLPPVDPGDYAEIQLRRPPVQVSDEAVDEALEQLRQRAARFEPVEDRGVETGDTVVIDLDRATVEGGEAEAPEHHDNVSVELGSPANPPGFDAELEGLRGDAEKTFRLVYPADYAVEALASKEIEYRVKVRAVRRRVVPPLDDDLAKEVSSSDTLEKLRGEVREQLTREAAHEAERQLRSDLLKALADRVTFEVPAVLIERDLNRRTQDFIGRLLAEGVDPRQTGLDWEAFRNDQRDAATQAVRATVVLDEVARREEIAVSDEDVERQVASLAERSGRPPATVRAQLDRDGDLDRLRAGLRRERTVDFLMSRVTIAGD